MLPTLSDGRIVLASSMLPAKKGRVGFIRYSGRVIVKRVDKIDNGNDSLYVLGDNKHKSTDSRQYGWLPKDKYIASVIWPKI